jgi:hypothetical protein
MAGSPEQCTGSKKLYFERGGMRRLFLVFSMKVGIQRQRLYPNLQENDPLLSLTSQRRLSLSARS